MGKKEIIIIADYTQKSPLSLHELCDICHISDVLVLNFIEHDIISPLDRSAESLIFDMAQLKRLQTALRLQRDLEVNLAGIALVLELLDELEELRTKTAMLEKHFLK